MPHISRFKRYNSDRTGFKFFEIELVKDGPFKVAGDELDAPPPSKKIVGGEGEVSTGDMRLTDATITSLSTPATLDNPVYYITAAGGIQPTFAHVYMRVAGSNSNITLTAVPQITAGKEGQILTLEGVGSSITMANANGLALMGSAPFVMNSGDVISFYYTTGGNVWWETSRVKGGGL